MHVIIFTFSQQGAGRTCYKSKVRVASSLIDQDCQLVDQGSDRRLHDEARICVDIQKALTDTVNRRSTKPSLIVVFTRLRSMSHASIICSKKACKTC